MAKTLASGSSRATADLGAGVPDACKPQEQRLDSGRAADPRVLGDGPPAMRTVILSVLLLLAPVLLAAAPSSSWQMPDGQHFKGRIADVFGGFVVIAGSNATAITSVDKMSAEELGRVAEFLVSRPAAAPWRQSKTTMAKAVLGAMVHLQEGKFASFDPGERTEPDIYLVYFSAGWCGPCHRFTPELVQAYERYRRVAPGKIEVVFVSWDETVEEQEAYARQMGMPWPAVKFHLRKSVRELQRWSGKGIPCLVALTRDGHLLAHSYRGEEYLGPSQVLEICDQLVDAAQNRSPAARRASHRLAVAGHVRSAAGADRPAEPYLIAVDGDSFAGIRAPDTVVEVAVDEQGRVTAVDLPPDFSMDLGRLVEATAANWLFLPAVKDGQPCAQRLRVPLKFGAQ